MNGPSTDKAILITIDGLSARGLGPYGDTWVETPGFNEFASQSVVFERAVSDGPRPERGMHSWLSGTHSCYEGESLDPRRLAQLFHSQDISMILVTDDPAMAGLADQYDFDTVETVPAVASDEPAGEVIDTQIAALLVAAIDVLSSLEPPFFLWIHARGVTGPWDAPYRFRLDLKDEDDPDPPTFVQPPAELIDLESVHPDFLLGVQQAYAAQVRAIDVCMTGFWDHLRDSGIWDDSLIAFSAPRGYPLGQHSVVGYAHEQLYSQATAVPLWLRLPGGAEAGLRVHDLQYAASLIPTITEHLMPSDAKLTGWQFGSLTPSIKHWDHQKSAVLYSGTRMRAMETPAWLLVEDSIEGGLFVKPDDRWEINNVASLRPAIVSEMRRLADELQRQIANGQPANWPNEIPSELLTFTG